MVDSMLYRGLKATAQVQLSFSRRPPEALELMALSGGNLHTEPANRVIAHGATDELWRRAATPFDLSTAFRLRMANLLGTGRVASADTLLREARRRNVGRYDIDAWTLLGNVTGIAPFADRTRRAAAARRLLDDARRCRLRHVVTRDLSRTVLEGCAGHVSVARARGPLPRRGNSTGDRRPRRSNETETTPAAVHGGPCRSLSGRPSRGGPSPVPLHERRGARGAPHGLLPPHPARNRRSPTRETSAGHPLRTALMLWARHALAPGRALPGRESP